MAGPGILQFSLQGATSSAQTKGTGTCMPSEFQVFEKVTTVCLEIDLASAIASYPSKVCRSRASQRLSKITSRQSVQNATYMYKEDNTQ